MRHSSFPSYLLAIGATLLFIASASAQTNRTPALDSATKISVPQSVTTPLATLPDADTLIYFSPQRILNDVAPRVMKETDVTNMRNTFEDIKKNIGVDPSKLDYAVIGVRFHKPTKELSFVPPDFLVVASGDFSAESLMTIGRLYLQDRARDEKYGSRTITVMKIDEIAKQAETNPMLKSFVELSAVALNANTLAFGNSDYLKAAIDAAEGNGRINGPVVTSLMRDPNALISLAGSPLAAFTKSFGMLGTDSEPRDSRCDTKFGDFYAAVTKNGDTFRLRGTLNADNPDTAKIVSNLILSLWPVASGAMKDQSMQDVLKSIKLSPQDSEVVVEADLPEQTVAKFIREQMATPKPQSTTPEKATKKRVRRHRPVKKQKPAGL